jgi:hypothetical protein
LPVFAGGRWGPDTANDWYAKRGWLVGCNFTPSTAVNQLEMWQAATFDLPAIKRELAYAQSLGFNSVRVFLHHLLWQKDRRGFLMRMDQFLDAAQRQRIGVMFVLLDGVWDPHPKLGRQPDPRPHVHNSGWLQSPGVEILSEQTRHEELRPYITGVIRHFRSDRRIDAWDLFNEPDNMNRPAYERFEPANKPELARRLLWSAFAWARAASPSQPLTAGVWIGNWSDPDKLSPIEKICLEESDIISFHNYGNLEDLAKCVQSLRRYQRPILCTEYMARPAGSTFKPHLEYLKQQKVGAYSWGLVAGKTQTVYPWDSWTKTYQSEPPVWFHDIFRHNGVPFDPQEVEYIRTVTGKRD